MRKGQGVGRSLFRMLCLVGKEGWEAVPRYGCLLFRLKS